MMPSFEEWTEMMNQRVDESGSEWFVDDYDISSHKELNEGRRERDLELLKKKFKKGTVTFEYRKKSTGQKRVAHGTLNFKKMKKDHFDIHPIPNYISQKFKEYPNLFVYYDMDQHNWRCFDISNFIGLYR